MNKNRSTAATGGDCTPMNMSLERIKTEAAKEVDFNNKLFVILSEVQWRQSEK